MCSCHVRANRSRSETIIISLIGGYTIFTHQDPELMSCTMILNEFAGTTILHKHCPLLL